MEMVPAILAERLLPYGRAELVEWDWPNPLDLVVREARHMIEMSLPPFAVEGSAAFPQVDPARFRFMGNLFVRPAGIDVHSRSVGGHIRVVRLAVDPDAGWAARALALEGERLALGLDIRASAPRMLLARIRDELIRPGRDSDALVQAYCDALMIEMARCIAGRDACAGHRARLADWQYQRVVERLEAPMSAPTVGELGALCGVGARHFARLYQARTGESPIRAIERARVQRAMALLGAGDVPVKRVAAELGFAHGGAFSTAFRRIVGVSPNRWRQQRRAHH